MALNESVEWKCAVDRNRWWSRNINHQSTWLNLIDSEDESGYGKPLEEHFGVGPIKARLTSLVVILSTREG